MSISKFFAGAAALSLAAAPIAVSAEEAISRDAAEVSANNELGGGELPWFIGPLLVVAGLVAIILIAEDDDPVSV